MQKIKVLIFSHVNKSRDGRHRAGGGGGIGGEIDAAGGGWFCL